jgi:tetratricopeptide (TPR) repeat protein
MKQKYTFLIVIFLIVASFVTYGRILGNGFVNFDDHNYITQNSHIKSGINPESIKWAFTSVVSYNWHPLTWLSHMLDWSLFKDYAGGHHLISLLLHIGVILLLFCFLNRTTKKLWPSAFVAALFALHPLRVESVAWAAERKDVLSMFFGLASIYTYACYVESSKLSKYFLCLMLFSLSLMAKPMLVTLPFVLLLLDYWPLNRWHNALKNEGERSNIVSLEKETSAPIKRRSYFIGRLLWEKVPFILLALVSSIATLWAQSKGGAVVPLKQLPFFQRVLNAIVSYVSYLVKIFSPVDLAVFYPYQLSFPVWQILISCISLIGVTIVVIYAIKKLPFLFVGWFWYLGTLIPVIGLVQVGMQAMADRYTYYPSIGIAIMLVCSIPLLFKSEDMRKNILFPVGIAYLAILTLLTWEQCGYWKNNIELWNHTLQVTRDNYRAHTNLAFVLAAEEKYEDAFNHFNKAVRLQPNDAHIYHSRGTTYMKIGQYQHAVEDFNKVILLNPDWTMAYIKRGSAYSELGQYQLAFEDYYRAIRLKLDHIDAVYTSRGIVYKKLGQYQLAIQDFNYAIRLNPDNSEAYSHRGYVYYKLGQYQQAMADYDESIRLKQDDASAYINRGNVCYALGQYQQAIDNFNKTIKLNINSDEAYNFRGVAYGKLGQYQQAIDNFNEAIKLKPGSADAYNNRGYAYLLQRNKELGCLDARKACELGLCKSLEWAKVKGLCR